MQLRYHPIVKLTHNILTARICTTTLNFSEIRVVQDNQILTPISITPPPPSSGPPPYCADVQVQLTATGTSQVHFELASEANAQTFVAQCCRSPKIKVSLAGEVGSVDQTGERQHCATNVCAFASKASSK